MSDKGVVQQKIPGPPSLRLCHLRANSRFSDKFFVEAVTKNDNKTVPKAPIKYEPTFKPKPKPKPKTARRSKATVGLDSHPKLGCVSTPDLIKALNHMALGYRLASDRKVIKHF